jgi:hypothetical protein
VKVTLRHRLLLQAEVGEGAVAVEIEVDACELAVAKRRDVRTCERDLVRVAPLATVISNEQEHAFAEIDGLFDFGLALSNVTVAADQTPVLAYPGKHDPTAEVTDLVKLVVEFLEGPEPVVNEATYRRSTLEVVSRRPPVKDRILGDVVNTPSTPRRFTAASCLRTSATGSGVVDPSGIVRPVSRARPRAGLKS